MRIVHSRRPLALAQFYKKFVEALVIVTSSQADPVYFFITKRVREPISWRSCQIMVLTQLC